jgi:hypothetical protein
MGVLGGTPTEMAGCPISDVSDQMVMAQSYSGPPVPGDLELALIKLVSLNGNCSGKMLPNA